MLLTLCILAEHKYFLLSISVQKKANENPFLNPYRLKTLFSGAFCDAKENSVCNPYRFKNVTKLTAKALGFIFFIQPGHYQLSFLQRNVTTRECVYADKALQKPTICL
jgi:hypothetical protein